MIDFHLVNGSNKFALLKVIAVVSWQFAKSFTMFVKCTIHVFYLH